MLKIIETEEEYELTLKRVGEIFNATPGTPEADELEVLVLIVEKYEEEHYPVPNPDPIEYIKVRMEVLGLKQKDMATYFGSEATASRILNRKQELNINHIRALWKGLRLDPQILISPSRLTN